MTEANVKLTAVPRDHGELLGDRCVRDTILLATELLELHRELALADLVVGEHLEVARKTERAARRDEPLRRVVLVPLDRIPVVHRELVVEVVVPLPEREQGGEEVVSRRELVVVCRLAQPVCDGVHGECGLGVWVWVLVVVECHGIVV